MKVVGLTGGIGSGKSTVAELFLKLGAGLIDADELAREVVEPGQRAWKEIREAFGEDVFHPDQTLNREALGEIIFSDPAARERLNAITHPRIGEEIIKRLEGFRVKAVPVVLIDAALLIESPATKWIRPVIVVTAPEQERIKRLKKRSGLAEEDAISRIRSQMPDKDRVANADYVLDNSGTLEELEKKVKALWDKIVE